MRLVLAAIMFCALCLGRASAEDNGEELFRKFAGTCATKPVSGAELDARARSLGYVSRNGSDDPDDGKRDLDFLYFWKLPGKGANFAVDAYFFGPRAHFQVVCSVNSDDIDFDAFVESLERNTSLPVPQVTSDPKTGGPVYGWTVDADGWKDILQVQGFGADHRRVDVRLTYDVVAR